MKNEIKNRIREVRENRYINQSIVADEIGVTQQMLSKYERDINNLKIDVLIKLSDYFNVTTDYLLGLSEVKRDLQRQVQMNKLLDEFYDFLESYKTLDKYDKELLWVVVQQMKKNNVYKRKDAKIDSK